MSWKPGQSGNPGGRPKVVAKVRRLAGKHTRAAINALVAMLTDEPNPEVRLKAAIALLAHAGAAPPKGPEVFIDARQTQRALSGVPTTKLLELAAKKGDGG